MFQNLDEDDEGGYDDEIGLKLASYSFETTYATSGTGNSNNNESGSDDDEDDDDEYSWMEMQVQKNDRIEADSSTSTSSSSTPLLPPQEPLPLPQPNPALPSPTPELKNQISPTLFRKLPEDIYIHCVLAYLPSSFIRCISKTMLISTFTTQRMKIRKQLCDACVGNYEIRGRVVERLHDGGDDDDDDNWSSAMFEEDNGVEEDTATEQMKKKRRNNEVKPNVNFKFTPTLSLEIEAALFVSHMNPSVSDKAAGARFSPKLYPVRALSLQMNLRRNLELKYKLVSGLLTPSTLITLSPETLLLSSQIKLREKFRQNIEAKTRLDGINPGSFQAGIYSCSACGSMNTRYSLMGKPDQRVKIFVFCLSGDGCRHSYELGGGAIR